jgi:hypothetical protein
MSGGVNRVRNVAAIFSGAVLGALIAAVVIIAAILIWVAVYNPPSASH